MSAWDPVILGIGVNDLRVELDKAMQRAITAGAPGAQKARIDCSGTGEVSVVIQNLSDAEAKALWNNHLEASVIALGGRVKNP